MCGVVGIIGTQEAARETFLGLTILQHRGQDAAGICTYDQDGFHRVKNIGLVDSVFNRDNMALLTGNTALGHARYSTIGRGDVSDVQPFVLNYPFGISIVHNGNIVNTAELTRELKKQKRHLLTQSDTEILLNLFAQGLSRFDLAEGDSLQFDQICKAMQEVFQKVNGSYSIVALIAGHGLLAFRDPHGIRPLIWGKKEGAHMMTSESAALSFNGYEVVRDVQPGEVIFIDEKGQVHSKVIAAKEARPCMFEWVYFASPESVLDGSPVYGSRIGLGKNLAKKIKTEFKNRGISADIVVPVPETARIAAIALSEELGIPYREVLIKNRYIKRTFILDSQDKRKKAVSLKLSPVRSEIEGKRVLLVDDSIVRGTTSRKLIELVRQAGASEVYFVSTCPPISYPCYYGIDFPIRSELIAYQKTHAEIEKELGADAVIYQDVEGLKQAIQKDKPCMACLTGEYPTNIGEAADQFSAQRDRHRLSRKEEM